MEAAADIPLTIPRAGKLVYECAGLTILMPSTTADAKRPAESRNPLKQSCPLSGT
jgi:hypothetical protein